MIATLLDLTGPNAGSGVDSQHGTELAVALRGGSVLGHPVRLTHFDGGCDSVIGERSASDPGAPAGGGGDRPEGSWVT